MLLEIHCHTSKYSKCSQVDPVSLVRQVVKKQLQGVIITEHRYLWSDEELLKLRRDAEVEDSFVIMAGQEVETDVGHMVLLGALESVTKRSSVKELKKSYPDAALILAHPFRGGRIPSERELLDERIDAIEIFSSNHTPKENYLGLAAWHKLKFTAVSGTDTHDKITAGILPTQFDHPVNNIADVVSEIKGARCRPFFKEIPKAGSNIIVTEITLGTKGEDELRDRIILRKFNDAKKWEKTKSTAEITEKLAGKGFQDGQFRIPKIIDVNEQEKLLIEEGQRGKRLFELLSTVNPSVGAEYYRMAARWLARFHNAGQRVLDAADTRRREENRMDSYLRSFSDSHSPYTDQARRIVSTVTAMEERLFSEKTSSFVLSHGDYHPKNIIIGQDRMHDISTLFISVIDFDNAIAMPRSFDVGYFLSQFASQYSASPGVRNAYNEDDFFAAYIREAGAGHSSELKGQLALFKLRANLSIASFFIKVGKGISSEMEDVMSRSNEIYGKMNGEG